MKKFILIISSLAIVYLIYDSVRFRLGFYIDLQPDEPVTTFVRTDEKQILMDTGEGFSPFEIKGVNMGSGKPGEWATDFAIDKDTYLRWFGYIKEMGANTVRVYTIQEDTFYNAFYEFNKDNPDPLYLIHGVWVNDYVQNSHRDAYSKDFYDTFLRDSKIMIDVIHGQRKLINSSVKSAGFGSYRKDISPWVIGYILGVEWDDVTVAYTDVSYAGKDGFTSFSGEYMYTTGEASPFEVLLAKVGDTVIRYESDKYKTQKPVAFSNWPTTDPFEYPAEIKQLYMKCAYVDVEHIKTTQKFLSGQFASYHVYPYYPDYMRFVEDFSYFGINDLSGFMNKKGEFNTYRLYLSLLNEHHTIPVVISEFGVSTGRGMAHVDMNTGRNQGNMSESEQGQALVDCYEDIRDTGCAGCCVFSWQDEWFKRTWNTMYSVDLTRTPYWSDYQTNEQYFGLLSFDPGKERSVCYVDGDVSEWEPSDVVSADGDMSVSVKYDEKFIYFLIHKGGLDFENDAIYIPIDTTWKTGSDYCQNFDLRFNRNVDFLIVINGKDGSRVMVQEPYEALRSTYSQNAYGYDTYLKDNLPDYCAPGFTNINMILEMLNTTNEMQIYFADKLGELTFETGKLRYGNANPDSAEFDSLADFCAGGEYVEIKIPWQLLNFSDPSKMNIHDDYYSGNYGVRYIQIDKMYVGITAGGSGSRCTLSELQLNGWGNKVTYHERLKRSYFVMQELWK